MFKDLHLWAGYDDPRDIYILPAHELFYLLASSLPGSIMIEREVAKNMLTENPYQFSKGKYDAIL